MVAPLGRDDPGPGDGYTELAARLKRLAAGSGGESAPQSAVATSSSADKYRTADEAEDSDATGKALMSS